MQKRINTKTFTNPLKLSKKLRSVWGLCSVFSTKNNAQWLGICNLHQKGPAMLHGSRLNHTPIYFPSSRNHGSLENGFLQYYIPFILVNFHFHDGRKGTFVWFFGVNKTMDPMKQFMDPMKRIQCQGTNCSHVSWWWYCPSSYSSSCCATTQATVVHLIRPNWVKSLRIYLN